MTRETIAAVTVIRVPPAGFTEPIPLAVVRGQDGLRTVALDRDVEALPQVGDPWPLPGAPT